MALVLAAVMMFSLLGVTALADEAYTPGDTFSSDDKDAVLPELAAGLEWSGPAEGRTLVCELGEHTHSTATCGYTECTEGEPDFTLPDTHYYDSEEKEITAAEAYTDDVLNEGCTAKDIDVGYVWTCEIEEHTHTDECYKAEYTWTVVETPSYTVSVTVLSDGNKVRNRTVTVGDATAVTDNNGVAVFTLPDGDYTASVSYTRDSTTYSGSADFTVAGDAASATINVKGVTKYYINHIDIGQNNGTQQIPKTAIVSVMYADGSTATLSQNGTSTGLSGEAQWRFTGFKSGAYIAGTDDANAKRVVAFYVTYVYSGNTYSFAATSYAVLYQGYVDCPGHEGLDVAVLGSKRDDHYYYKVVYKYYTDGALVYTDSSGVVTQLANTTSVTLTPETSRIYAGNEYALTSDASAYTDISIASSKNDKDKFVTITLEYGRTSPTYGVTYEYQSGSTEALPDEISTTTGAYAVSDPDRYSSGEVVQNKGKADGTQFATATGTWTLTWNKTSETVVSSDVAFIGTWVFTLNTEGTVIINYYNAATYDSATHTGTKIKTSASSTAVGGTGYDFTGSEPSVIADYEYFKIGQGALTGSYPTGGVAYIDLLYTHDTGSFYLHKTSSGYGFGAGDAISFTVRYNDTGDETVFRLLYMENGEWSEGLCTLDTGSYTITEAAPDFDGYGRVTTVTVDGVEAAAGKSVTFTLAKDSPLSITFDNAYEVKTGTLLIEKSITGLADGEYPGAMTFTVTPDPDNTVICEPVVLTLDASAPGAEWTVENGVYVCALELPEGAYTVAETGGGLEGYIMTADVPAGISVRWNGIYTAKVTNSYEKETVGLTVIHNYYLDTTTNGVTVRTKDGTVSETVEGVKRGDVITVAELRETAYGGNTYTFESSDPAEAEYTVTQKKNTITINYVRTVTVKPKDETPKTGDGTDLPLLWALFIVSVMSLGALGFDTLRKKEIRPR